MLNCCISVVMPIPDYQTIMLPLLKFFGDQKEHSISEAIVHISLLYDLTEEEKRQVLPSGVQPTIDNRVSWARTYLKKAQLIDTPRKGYAKITARGLAVLDGKPKEINRQFLSQFPEFVEFQARKKDDGSRDLAQRSLEDSLDPLELLEASHMRIQNELAEDLLGEAKKTTPKYFERLVLELLRKMGYGGYLAGSEEHTGKCGDEGIDGKIKEDRLGLDVIYVQAKKWAGPVGRPEIHKFVGALKGQGANKGILITTSWFSHEASGYASKIDSPKIVLIDGKELAKLMIEFDLGVTKLATYDVKRKDSDYFIED
jgi:restriction system protein